MWENTSKEQSKIGVNRSYYRIKNNIAYWAMLKENVNLIQCSSRKKIHTKF